MKRLAHSRAGAAFAVALALLLVTTISIAGLLRRDAVSAELVNHTHDVIEAAQALLSTLKDAESGQRGYLLTGNIDYLSPYSGALARIERELTGLRALVADNPEQSGRLPRIEDLTRAKLAELAQTVALHRSDAEAALGVVRGGRGKSLMAGLRDAIGAFTDEERNLLVARGDQLDRIERAAAFGSVAAAVSAVLSALLGGYFLLRQGREADAGLARTEAELSDRLAQLRATYDGAPVGLAFVGLDLRYVALNERLAALNGHSVSDHLGRTVGEVVPGIEAPVETLYRRVIETGEPIFDVEIRAATKASRGEARDFIGNYWPVRDAAGALIGVNVAVMDMTERNAANAALAAGEARLRAVYDTVPVGLVMAELPSGRILDGNAYVERVTGHPFLPSAGLDQYDDWVSYHADGTRVSGHEYPIARIALAGEEAPEIEVLYDRAGTRTWTRIMGRPVRDQQGVITGAVVALLDIDKEKRAGEILEAEVAARTHELTLSNRALADTNAQLDAFVYTISHDLRAPLRAMEGFARILLDDFEDALGSVGGRYARRIVSAAARMESLIDDLLSYSRLQRADVVLQRVGLATLAASCAEQVLAAAAPLEAVSITVRNPLPFVLAEPVVLRQVLLNLLGNATKFRHPGTHVAVVVRAERLTDKVRVWVEDDGIGIAAEHQGRIFNVFERLHGQETFPGTGIGLAIVRKGVERMGGRCGVVSAIGEGSRFWFELAAADGEGGEVGHE